MKTIKKQVISQRKYNHLSKFKQLSNTDRQYMKDFEDAERMKVLNNKQAIEYIKNVRSINLESISQPSYIKLTKSSLWKKFNNAFLKINRKPFIQDTSSIKNIKPLIYYFINDFENFKKCENISNITKPNPNKGLLIIGNLGCGKTSLMNALEKATIGSNLHFKSYTANDVVTRYEACNNQLQKNELMNELCSGIRYFDDVMSEREVNNFGKIDLFREVLEKRYANNKKTFITINYNPNYPNNTKKALEKFGERYGMRVYDRLFEMFNVITFTGDSWRQ